MQCFAFKKASEEVASFKGATAVAARSVRGLGTASTETGERMGILSSMTSATARGLSDMSRSAARVDGTMKGAYEDFTSVFEVVGRMAGGMIGGVGALFGFNKGISLGSEDFSLISPLDLGLNKIAFNVTPSN